LEAQLVLLKEIQLVDEFVVKCAGGNAHKLIPVHGIIINLPSC